MKITHNIGTHKPDAGETFCFEHFGKNTDSLTNKKKNKHS